MGKNYSNSNCYVTDTAGSECRNVNSLSIPENCEQ